jgi:hypothetical protein
MVLITADAWGDDNPVPQTARVLPIHIDGQLLEPAWHDAKNVARFGYPWSKKAAPKTEFRALIDKECLWLSFEVEDHDIVVAGDFSGESSVDQEDRVEIFFAADNALTRYYCLEIDPPQELESAATRSKPRSHSKP